MNKRYNKLIGDNTDICYSLNVEELLRYYSQFEEYFKAKYNDVKIMPVNNRTELHEKLLDYELVWLTNDIIVTSKEHGYYTRVLMELYADTKNMLSQMLITNKIVRLDTVEKTKIIDAFESTYRHFKSYDEFINSLDTEVILSEYIINPGVFGDMTDIDDALKIQLCKEG